MCNRMVRILILQSGYYNVFFLFFLKISPDYYFKTTFTVRAVRQLTRWSLSFIQLSFSIFFIVNKKKKCRTPTTYRKFWNVEIQPVTDEIHTTSACIQFLCPPAFSSDATVFFSFSYTSITLFVQFMWYENGLVYAAREQTIGILKKCKKKSIITNIFFFFFSDENRR